MIAWKKKESFLLIRCYCEMLNVFVACNVTPPRQPETEHTMMIHGAQHDLLPVTWHIASLLLPALWIPADRVRLKCPCNSRLLSPVLLAKTMPYRSVRYILTFSDPLASQGDFKSPYVHMVIVLTIVSALFAEVVPFLYGA